MKWVNRSVARILFAAALLALASVIARGVRTASAEDVPLMVDRTCSPETFRPDEWVVVECVSHLTNNGDAPMSDIRAVVTRAEGVIPDHFFVLYEVNGQAMPIEPTSLGLGGEGVLPPGETAEVRVIVLQRMDEEGTYEGDWQVTVEGQAVKTTPVRYEAKSDAAAPPKDLLVSREIVAGGTGDAKVYYRTTVTNQGSKPVTDLTLTERYDEAALLFESYPTTASEKPDVQIARWDLASFGKESLAPGDSLVLDTGYRPPSDSTCAYVQAGAMVEASVGGVAQRYGARAEDVTVGACGRGNTGGGSGGDGRGGDGGGEEAGSLAPPGAAPVAAPRTGEGRTSTGRGASWAAGLCVVGASLVGAAALTRRRVRR